MIPKPKLPKLNLNDEGVEEVIPESVESEKQIEELGKEKIANAFAKVLGFIAAIGLPEEVMKQKIKEYSSLADETGVADAVVDVIEYYFPDLELSPAFTLLLTGIAFLSAVMADRAEIKKKIKKQKKETRSEKMLERKEKIKEEVKTSAPT